MKNTLILCTLIIILNCGLYGGERLETPPQSAPDASDRQAEKPFKKPAEYNFKFIGVDVGIPDNNEKKSYYRIFIDRAEAGRTTVDLDSKDKIFEAMLAAEKHEITVEKFSLDESKQRFVKLHNIDQPKPDKMSFTIETDKILIVKLTQHASRGGAFFTIEYERE